ncbi:54S ribosomal protein L27, mitochondrial [[Candida] anglica]|uniref:54S ribosomal protein L27, mitochondrial n=1 Tax=[Candida] anglica TaxID=148631 RepID=A0ABP0EJR6_9ASCO
MRGSQILSFQQTAVANLRRPWQTFKDGQIWYGQMKSGSKRHALTTKQGNKNFYKGTGSSGIGKLNSRGLYIVDWSKVRTYVVPPPNPELKALVSASTPEILQKFVGYKDQFKDPEYTWDSIVNFIENGEGYSEINLEETDYLEKFVKPGFEESS